MNKIRTLMIAVGISSISTLAMAQQTQYPLVRPGDSIPPGTTAQLLVADTGQRPDPQGLTPVITSTQPVTRGEVKQDLRNLEKVGYQPEGERSTYPVKTQQAEKRLWKNQEAQSPQTASPEQMAPASPSASY